MWILHAVVFLAAFWVGGGLPLGGQSPATATPSQATPDITLTDADVIGCYELLSLAWTQPFTSAKRVLSPPRVFELTSERLPASTARRIRSREESGLPRAQWQLTSNNELNLNWTAGFRFVRIVARRGISDGQFHGQAEIWEESYGRENLGEVVFARVPCSAAVK
jgi:hypothetical protein